MARPAADGCSSNEITDPLANMTLTATAYRLVAKLGARNRAQLVVFAYKSGWTTPWVAR